jgi:hypothetical protein
MKNKLKITMLSVLTVLMLNTSVAKADPTYAVLDTNGNVTNIIVCGSACASGEFAGNKVVLQVAADPVTGENRGGLWQGQGTTVYNENTGVFTITDNSPSITTNIQTDVINISTIKSIDENILTTEVKNDLITTSSIEIDGIKTTSFIYQDTIGQNLFTRNGFVYNYSDNAKATVYVILNDIVKIKNIDSNGTENTISAITNPNGQESFSFNNRKTIQEIEESINFVGLSLLNSKIQTLISLLGSWVK